MVLRQQSGWLPIILASSLCLLTACGGGGSSSSTTTSNTSGNTTDTGSDTSTDTGTNTGTDTGTTTNTAPTANNLTATTTANLSTTITLTGSDADGDTLTYSIASQPAHGTVTLSGAKATYKPTSNYTGSDSFTYQVNDGTASSSAATVSITVNASTVVQPSPTGQLNDTGITDCGNYPFTTAGKANGHLTTSTESCALTTTAEGDVIPATQDGQSGRDYTNNDDSDGVAGFSFTKISSTGKALAADATSWACVKDNVTGLIWEVKTNDGGLHDMDWQYTWYNTDNTTNGGGVGVQDGGHCQGSQCDTQSYVEAVNAQGLCGSSNWRLPEVDELQSIVDHTKHDPVPTIDANYFPNTHAWIYWSATPYARAFDYAWFIGFNGGNDNWSAGKGYDSAYVRLVRSN